MAKRASQDFGGGWTERKLSALRDYLEAYKTALSNTPFYLEYIDAFAGTGYRQQKTVDGTFLFPELADEAAQEYLDGSARVALQVSKPFDRYTFVELSRDKSQELAALSGEFPNLADRIHVVASDANEYLLSRAHEDWLRNRARSVVFIDPFGMQIEWKTVEALAATQAVDLWLLYPVSAINRLLSASGVKFETWERRLDIVFGGPEWRDAFYVKQSTRDMFEGDRETQVKHVDIDGLTKFMVDKLDSVFAKVVKRPLVLTTNSGSPLFALCFAAANPRGAGIACRIAKQILEK